MEELEKMGADELKKLLQQIQDELKKRQINRYELHLKSLKYNDSDRCWVAKVDRHKNILEFVNPYTAIKVDNNGVEKIFFLPDGYYLSCEVGAKSYDTKTYFKVTDGKRIDEQGGYL